MKTTSKQHNSRNSKIMQFIFFIVVFSIILGIFLMRTGSQKDSFPLFNELSVLQTERQITPEEYRFFTALARKKGLGTDEAEIKQYIAHTNAEFYLGSHMEICEPFDYAVLQYRTQAENQDRAMKKLTGQLYYGPDSFSEEGYFEYIHSRLRSDMLSWLVAHRDPDMVDAARKFFDKNKDRFTAIKSVTYEVTENGVTEKKVLEDTMFRTMGQSDPTLMDALEKCEIGESRALKDGTGRTVKKLDIQTELTPFEDQEPYVVELWLNNEALDKLISAVADNSKLVF